MMPVPHQNLLKIHFQESYHDHTQGSEKPFYEPKRQGYNAIQGIWSFAMSFNNTETMSSSTKDLPCTLY